MKDRLSYIERRHNILEYLESAKVTTRKELAKKFNVSSETIRKDIDYLTGIAPIYTKQGNKGGVFIYPEFHYDRKYLTDDEKALLKAISKQVSVKERKIINGIIFRFSKEAVLGI
ncbi:MAG: HTH domain-containing protein [Clostridia bacterium]|nr:HTH domain-containing protein [Clostridia bacterium]